MKKNNTDEQSSKKGRKALKGPITIGLDLGDKTSRYCLLDGKGEVVQERSIVTTKKGMAQAFGAMPRCRIAIEVGTHSPWVSRLLKGLGFEVIVANARQVKLISQSSPKTTGWTRRCWRAWHESIHSCSGRSGIAGRKRKKT